MADVNIDVDEAGFTFVETLVVLVLTSILAVWLLEGLRTAMTSWRSVSQRTEMLEAVTSTQAILRRVLSNAYPYYTIRSGKPGRVEFAGSASEIRFLGTAPASHFDSAEIGYSIRLERYGDHFTLLLGADLGGNLNTSEMTFRDRVLLADIKSVTFEFWGVKKDAKVAQWHNDWIDQLELPRLIRVNVVLAKAFPGTWPALIVSPRVNVDASCALDLLTKLCRGR